MFEVNQLQMVLNREELKPPDKLAGEEDGAYKERLKEVTIHYLFLICYSLVVCSLHIAHNTNSSTEATRRDKFLIATGLSVTQYLKFK